MNGRLTAGNLISFSSQKSVVEIWRVFYLWVMFARVFFLCICEVVKSFSDQMLFITASVFRFLCWNNTLRSLQKRLSHLAEQIIDKNPYRYNGTIRGMLAQNANLMLCIVMLWFFNSTSSKNYTMWSCCILWLVPLASVLPTQFNVKNIPEI